MTRDEVKEGMEVRVIANNCSAHWRNQGEIPKPLVPGDIVTLTGGFYATPAGKIGAYYYNALRTQAGGYVYLEDLEPSLPNPTPNTGSRLCDCPVENFTLTGRGCVCGGV